MELTVDDTKAYSPEYVLHGSHFPIHLTWPRSFSPTIRLFPASGTRVVHFNNVSRFQAEPDGSFTISGLEEPGYLSLVLKAPIIEEKERQIDIRLEIVSVDGTKLPITRTIRLFAPSVTADIPTEPIMVTVGDVAEQPTLSHSIALQNNGEGLALVRLSAREESPTPIIEPESVRKFRDAFWGDFLSHIKKSPHVTSEFLSAFRTHVKYSKDPPAFEEEQIKEIEQAWTIMRESLRTSPQLRNDWLAAGNGAILNNLNLFADLEVFLAYVKSMEAANTIAVNALDVVSLQPGITRILANLQMTDLAFNNYKDTPVDITFVSTTPVEVPVYLLLKALPTRPHESITGEEG